jgi:hypothetical protein
VETGLLSAASPDNWYNRFMDLQRLPESDNAHQGSVPCVTRTQAWRSSCTPLKSARASWQNVCCPFRVPDGEAVAAE